MSKLKSKVEFGDFQTPVGLALDVVSQIPNIEEYDRLVEPTCGVGAFLEALLKNKISSSKVEGWEINPEYVVEANKRLSAFVQTREQSIVREQDFFAFDFSTLDLSSNRYLFLGNPPWVTNSELGRLLSDNLPEKANFQGLSGMEAMTGKSNFDISEWMLIQLLKIISGTGSSIAFLIKTSVARKLFEFSCKENLSVCDFRIKKIDAQKHFSVSVDACLFYASGCAKERSKHYTLDVYSELEGEKADSVMGFVNGRLVSDVVSYDKYKNIDSGSEFKWRSGVKHDASKVMEFDAKNGELVNGMGERVFLPDDYLYPMYKSSSIAKEKIGDPKKKMLITQRKVGDNTNAIKQVSEATWLYLCDHSEKLDSRKSSIYKNAPRFSIFGVGEYTFKPWKIVISGLYKNAKFSKIGCYEGKPIVVDDTCYMIGFDTEREADFVLSLLLSNVCQKFIQSIIFLDNKRPITVALLSRISLREVSKLLGLEREYEDILVQQDSG